MGNLCGGGANSPQVTKISGKTNSSGGGAPSNFNPPTSI